MSVLTVDADNYGMNDVQNMGYGMNIVTGNFDFDSSYPTGGEDFNLENYFHKDVVTVLFTNKAGYVFEYDKDNNKVKAYYADYDASADGALIEVADGTDLSSVTGVKFIAIGY